MAVTDAKELARLAVEALEDRKAIDVKVIDIEKISTLADYFIKIIVERACNRDKVIGA